MRDADLSILRISLTTIRRLPTGRLVQNLHRAQSRRANTIERVSSGFRLNQAGDDPAGSAVASTLFSRQRSVRMAIRNIQSGLNAMGVADSGIDTLTDLVQRLRELAMQGASETLSDDERAYLQHEADELLEEIDQIARNSHYQGQNLLSHKGVDVVFVLDTTKSMFNEMPKLKEAMNWFNDHFQDQGLDVGIGIAYAGAAEDSEDGLRLILGVAEGNTGQAIDNIPELAAALLVGGMDPLSAALNLTGIAGEEGEEEPDRPGWRSTSRSHHIVYVSDAGQEIDLTPGADTGLSVGQSLANAGYVFHTMNRNTHDGVFTDLVNETGGTQNLLNAFGTDAQASMEVIAAEVEADLDETDTYDIQVDIDNNESSRLELDLPVDCSGYGLDIVDLDLSTRDGCMDALDRLDDAIDILGEAIGRVGASTQRLEHALSFQMQRETNLAHSVSQIRDADMAQETSNLTKDAIMEQAATMSLIQANQLQLEAITKLLG